MICYSEEKKKISKHLLKLQLLCWWQYFINKRNYGMFTDFFLSFLLYLRVVFVSATSPAIFVFAMAALPPAPAYL
jgi:hypothetical protein